MEGIFRRCKGAKLGEPKTAQVDNTTVYRHKHGKTKRTRPEHNTLGGFLGTGGGNRIMPTAGIRLYLAVFRIIFW